MKTVVIRALSSHSQPKDRIVPLHDEMWSINNAHDVYGFRPDLIIAMDDLARDYKMDEHKQYVLSIVNAGCPVYSARTDDRWPLVTPYPLAKVLDALDMDAKAWPLFENTLSYAFAMALAEKFERIYWFGADWRYRYDDIELKLATERWKLRGSGRLGKCPGWPNRACSVG